MGRYVHLAHAAGSNVGHCGVPGYLHSYDLAVLDGDSPWGPFRNPRIIPHAAGGWTAKIAADRAGRHWAIMFGDNIFAPWWLCLGLVPLEVANQNRAFSLSFSPHIHPLPVPERR